jgi:hypothetical protein
VQVPRCGTTLCRTSKAEVRLHYAPQCRKSGMPAGSESSSKRSETTRIAVCLSLEAFPQLHSSQTETHVVHSWQPIKHEIVAVCRQES